MEITGDYVSEKKATQFIDDENDNKIIFLRKLLLSVTGVIVSQSLSGFIKWTTLKSSITTK